MNLFLECVRHFSKLAFHELVVQIEPDMPRHFLLSTLRLQSYLEEYRREVEDIAAFLSDRSLELMSWRNPEVYGQIALLAKRAALRDDLSTSLESLRLQLGIVHPRVARLEDGVYRLAHVDGSIYLVSVGDIRELRRKIVTRVKGFRGLVFLPFANLFADLVNPFLYRPVCNSFNRRNVRAQLARAFELLESYSPELNADLQDLVKTIVLVPDLGDLRRWSYNLRLAYFGGIFINPFVVGSCGLVEALIHEYMHQRLWQWWAYEPPSGLPSEDVTIRSPITGREKSASVMVHAFIIYVSVYDFYMKQLLRDISVSHKEKRWIEVRASLLAESIPKLYEELSNNLQSGSAITSMLDYVREWFKVAEVEGRAP